jgi:Na+/proline symporter/signal transduction histidine kinase/CheY-like chemotaxis protein
VSGWFAILAALGYVLSLFAIASYGDRRRAGKPMRKGSPLTYSLSLAIYCTSWTFFGSVGLAATAGFEFLAIYVGPILAVTVGHRIFAHIIAVSKAERVTSVADFIAARYGKSTVVGALAALIAVMGTVPYIALQLKAISSSIETMVMGEPAGAFIENLPQFDTGLILALLLAFFAVLFGTRHADATEHQAGLVLAVATESVVKLVAFLCVGFFTLFVLFDGPQDLVAQAAAKRDVLGPFTQLPDMTRFAVITVLSFCAFLLLPRQFHMAVVENGDPRETRAARWMFPTYLVLINLFVVPVSIAGLVTFGAQVDADTYVLSLPISVNANVLSTLVFIGGLSAATAMVIVASVALAIMVSNNLVLPLMLAGRQRWAGNMGPLLLNIRRTAIFAILILAYTYVRVVGDGAALASIGLLAFAAIAQFAPAFFGALIWRKGTAAGAGWGMAVGFAVWVYTLFLPTLLAADAPLLLSGPAGLTWLRPQAMFGLDATPLVHGTLLSLALNVLTFCAVSLLRKPSHSERVQAMAFALEPGGFDPRPSQGTSSAVTLAELKATVANYLGYERTERAFEAKDRRENNGLTSPRSLASGDDIIFAERSLTAAIGAASARLVMSLLLRRHDAAPQETLQLLDDASRALRENRDLLHTAIDQVDQGLAVFDAKLELSIWNRRFRNLLRLPEYYGQPGTRLADICEGIAEGAVDEDADAQTIAERLLQTGERWELQIASPVTDAPPTVIEVLSQPLPEGGIVVSWSDTTQSVEAARALRVANESLEERVRERTAALSALNHDLASAREAAEAADAGKTRFLAAVGHDILQPLNAARLYATSLAEGVDGKSAQLAGNVDSALESVEEILEAVLAISRLDAGGQEATPRAVNLQALFSRLEREAQPLAEEKGLKLHVDDANIWVRSDPALLRRLLQNLLSNALKYTEEGKVSLIAAAKGHGATITVTDSGCGMSLEEQALVYQEFTRLKSGRDRAPGLGLGLSIVDRLTRALDHDLALQSTLGAGSTFTLRLPRAKAPSTNKPKEGPATPSPTANTAKSMAGLNVLCVDNEAVIRDGMLNLLSRWGCDPQASADLDEACKAEKPDAVVADYHLDNETGLDVIAALRARHGGELPAILLTADRSPEVAAKAAEAQVPMLQKPVKPAALRALLSTFARQKASAG